MRLLRTILSIMFIYSCVPLSDTPLTYSGKEKNDASVCGTWCWKDDCEYSYVHIGIDETTHQLVIIVVDVDKLGEIELLTFSGHTSLLKNNRYLNLKCTLPENEIPGYLFVKYSVTENTLGISIIDSTAIEKAIMDGSIKGEIINTGSLLVKITESQKELQTFIMKNDKTLFGKMIKLNRVKLRDGHNIKGAGACWLKD